MDDGPKAFPGHGSGPVQHGRYVVQQGSIPVIFQQAPTAFDRVVFAVIRRLVNQYDFQTVTVGNLHHRFHELRPEAGVLRAVVQVDDQLPNVGMTLSGWHPTIAAGSWQ